jgi:hypothetical protein
MEQGTLIRNPDPSLAQAGGDQCIPLFRKEAILNEEASNRTGMRKFDTVEMVEIIIPGDPGNKPHRRVTDQDRARWPDHYARFLKEQEFAIDGFPIDEWSSLSPAQCMEFKAMGFYTVESIAECSDSNIGKLGLGGMMLRDRARARLESMKTGTESEALVAQNAQLRTQQAAQNETIEALKRQVEELAQRAGLNIAEVEDKTKASLSHAHDAIAAKRKSLPEGWQELGARDMVALAGDIDEIVVKPRNKGEALQVLTEYQASIDATQ